MRNLHRGNPSLIYRNQPHLTITQKITHRKVHRRFALAILELQESLETVWGGKGTSRNCRSEQGDRHPPSQTQGGSTSTQIHTIATNDHSRVPLQRAIPSLFTRGRKIQKEPYPQNQKPSQRQVNVRRRRLIQSMIFVQ